MTADPLPDAILSEIVLQTLWLEEGSSGAGCYLRLVNQWWNDQVLRIWYVTLQAEPPQRPLIPSHRSHNKTSARRYLQGTLLRHQTDCKADFGYLASLASAIDDFRASEVRPQPALEEAAASVLGDSCSSVVCDALAGIYLRTIMLAVNDGAWPYLRIDDRGSAAWQFAAACLSGDADLIRLYRERYQASSPCQIQYEDFLRSCLCTAIQHGWTVACQCLTVMDFDINPSESAEGRRALVSAVAYARLDLLQALLLQKGRINKGSKSYQIAYVRAFQHHNRDMRKIIVQLLLDQGECPPSNMNRHEIFFHACRVDDSDWALNMLDMGPIDLYGYTACQSMRVSHRSAFETAALYNSVDCMGLILNQQVPESIDEAQMQKNIRRACEVAVKSQAFQVLRMLLPAEFAMTCAELFLLTAKIDGGLALIEELHGLPDLSQKVPYRRGGRAAGSPSTLGVEALWQAMWNFQAANVKYLFLKGAVPSERMRPKAPTKESEISALEAISALMSEHGYPLLDPEP